MGKRNLLSPHVRTKMLINLDAVCLKDSGRLVDSFPTYLYCRFSLALDFNLENVKPKSSIVR